ncbi:BZ3500_MvSof-1268-A1-R1_Chr3-1g05649 [Microbotryum saponariae]|uniref:BZ3500_MvSof-1268-A1-R1_Chr3-1g05649 protein n=1 Tax=Microbotryum saponariae TaxID=289078 RepID=A0A2X0LG65_9BASI|nr:BZ3500_MvSof-1268-A1-R1_Chr3-1g05649 [Microbotryum saponariae]SDA04839.1 BZ3501_MvSof-1269-A2-R1_Chr3-1g05319 [Microbotryum saponariae]
MRISVFSALSLVSAALAQSLLINTPTSLIECQPYAVTWSGGTAPYYVSVLPGGQLSATALTTLGEQPTTSTTYTWTVNIASGTTVTLKVLDSAGNSAYTAQVTIQAGSSNTCLTASKIRQSITAGAAPASSSGAAASSAVSSGAAASSAAVSSAAASSAAPATSSAAATSAAPAATTTPEATTTAAATTASAAAAATSSRAASGASLVGFSSTLLGVVGAAFLAIGA